MLHAPVTETQGRANSPDGKARAAPGRDLDPHAAAPSLLRAMGIGCRPAMPPRASGSRQQPTDPSMGLGNQAILRMRGPSRHAPTPSGPVAAGPVLRIADQVVSPAALPLQRVCACGGDCPKCRSNPSDLVPEDVAEDVAEDVPEQRLVQRVPTAGTAGRYAPPIVHEVLRSPGQPLDPATRAQMETRLGHDLSRVRIHTDRKAAESARAVNALAYTVGQDIVFGQAQYAPAAGEGQRLLAHELTHVVQQSSTRRAMTHPAHELPIAHAMDPMEKEAIAIQDTLAAPLGRSPDPQAGFNPRLRRGTGQRGPLLQRQPTTPSAPSPPLRGPNPASCLDPLCRRLIGRPIDSNQELHRRAQSLVADAGDCLRARAPASNATHAHEILESFRAALSASVDDTLHTFDTLPAAQRPRRRREYLGFLQDTCLNFRRMAAIEFNYNIILDNTGSASWGTVPADWDSIEGALAALPPEATWANPFLLRFRRAATAPSAGGQSVGGQTNTDVARRTANIDIYVVGLGADPMPRSTALGLPRTYQTVRHEIGHVVISQIPSSERTFFFEQIIGWYPYSWDYITWAPYPAAREERSRLLRELGMSGAQLDAWLGGLQLDTPVQQGPRTYTKRRVVPGANAFWLHSYLTSQVPGDRVFDYARTDPGEYLPELYALAVSRPEYLHAVLPPDQVTWLKEAVFHTPAPRDWAVGLPEPFRTDFLVRGSRLFTDVQLRALFDEIMVESQRRGSRLG